MKNTADQKLADLSLSREQRYFAIQRQRELETAAELLEALGQCLEALRNVPCVGDVFDQQHADTHLRADQLAESIIAKVKGGAA